EVVEPLDAIRAEACAAQLAPEQTRFERVAQPTLGHLRERAPQGHRVFSVKSFDELDPGAAVGGELGRSGVNDAVLLAAGRASLELRALAGQKVNRHAADLGGHVAERRVLAA